MDARARCTGADPPVLNIRAQDTQPLAKLTLIQRRTFEAIYERLSFSHSL